MQKIHLKMKALEWSQHILHNKSLGNFPSAMGANSAAGGLVRQNFEPIHDFRAVFVICKNGADPINNKGTRVVTSISLIFQTLQGS